MDSTPSTDLHLAVGRLDAAGPEYPEYFAIWVTSAPLPSAYGHRDALWPIALSEQWLTWQQLYAFSQHQPIPDRPATAPPLQPQGQGLGSHLMQSLGIALWSWLSQGAIQNSFAQSWGLALGQGKELRFRLDIRDANLIPLPWEIMQPDPGKSPISLHPQILFSRTIGDVDPLRYQPQRRSLDILAVFGEPSSDRQCALDLAGEAEQLRQTLSQTTGAFPHHLTTLIQPDPASLLRTLAKGEYNLFLYSGHGTPGPDGGQVQLQPRQSLSGRELAHALVGNGVAGAVFNSCWGAQPATQGLTTLAGSSLAEVLIHHGLPAVVAMRDPIADPEALQFMQQFIQALCTGHPFDRAMALARQSLLALYQFNQVPWTLPILYLHPQFDGRVVLSPEEGITELPSHLGNEEGDRPTIQLRTVDAPEPRTWTLTKERLRIGRRSDNDVVIPEKWVSQYHGEIFYLPQEQQLYLRDFSRFGTLLYSGNQWHKLHQQEQRLQPGDRLKFGSSYGETWEISFSPS